jgi:hypothetical protein
LRERKLFATSSALAPSLDNRTIIHLSGIVFTCLCAC